MKKSATQCLLLRLQKRLGTMKLAEALGTHRQNVWQWIRGKNSPSAAARKLIELLGAQLNGRNGSH